MEVKYPILTIDPGINIGLAVFYAEFVEPVITKVIKAKDTNNWQLNRRVVLNGFKYEAIKLYKTCKTVYIEKPQFMQSHMGMTAARSDSLFKLICVYGGRIYILEEIGFMVNEIDVNWKGNLDKQKLAARLQRRHGFKYEDHIADAVGMGLYVKGIF